LRGHSRDGPLPHPSILLTAVIKRPTHLWRGYFLTWPEGKKFEKFDIFRGNFPNPNPNHRWVTQPELLKIDLSRPGSKVFDLDPSLGHSGPLAKWWPGCCHLYRPLWLKLSRKSIKQPMHTNLQMRHKNWNSGGTWKRFTNSVKNKLNFNIWYKFWYFLTFKNH